MWRMVQSPGASQLILWESDNRTIEEPADDPLKGTVFTLEGVRPGARTVQFIKAGKDTELELVVGLETDEIYIFMLPEVEGQKQEAIRVEKADDTFVIIFLVRPPAFWMVESVGSCELWNSN